MRIASTGILLCISSSCSRPPETVAAWRERLSHSSECTTPPVLLPTWPLRPVTSPPGQLHLPPTSRAAGTRGTQTLWVGLDSTEVAHIVSTEPSSVIVEHSSLMSRLRRPNYHLEHVCRLKVAGRDTLIDAFEHVDSAKADTVFGLAASVALSRRRFAEVFALTPRAPMRDSLLAAVASLQWQ